MIIDIHGHYTTAPKALEAWRNPQIAGMTDPSARPKVSELRISDEDILERNFHVVATAGTAVVVERDNGSECCVNRA